MQGKMQAVAVMTCAAGLSLVLPLIGLVSNAVLALYSLRKGLREGLWLLGMGGVTMAVIDALTTGTGYLALGFSLLVWLPLLLVSIALRETGSLAVTLELAFGLGSLVVLAIYAINSDPSAYWSENLHRVTRPLLTNAPPELDANTVSANINVIAHYMSGMVIGGAVLTMVLSLFLGRWWQDLLFNPGGFSSEFNRMKMHSWLAYVCLALVGVALFTDASVGVRELTSNMSIPLLILFLINGLAVIHALLAKKESWRFLVTGLYILLFIVPHMILPVTLVGLSDVWLDWRKKGGLTA